MRAEFEPYALRDRCRRRFGRNVLKAKLQDRGVEAAALDRILATRWRSWMTQAAQAHDLKLTKNQHLVLSVLESSRQPLSAYSILDRLRGHGLKAPLQVYRALEKLLEAGRVHRLESMNAFVVCCHSRHGQIHPRITAFEICESCGKVNEFHDEKVESALIQHARSSGFKIRASAIEVHGLCADCH